MLAEVLSANTLNYLTKVDTALLMKPGPCYKTLRSKRQRGLDGLIEPNFCDNGWKHTGELDK